MMGWEAPLMKIHAYHICQPDAEGVGMYPWL